MFNRSYIVLALAAQTVFIVGCPTSISSGSGTHSTATLSEVCQVSCKAQSSQRCSKTPTFAYCDRNCNDFATVFKGCDQQWIDLNDCMGSARWICDATGSPAIDAMDCKWQLDAFSMCGSDAGGGDAGASSADASSSAADSAVVVAADGGAAADGGTQADSGAATDGWFCTQVNDACSCVPASAGIAQDKCTMRPSPACCFTDTMNGVIQGCQCYPVGAAACSLIGTSGYAAVSTCPPK